MRATISQKRYISNWGLNKGGTSRKKVKIIDTAVTTDSREVVKFFH
jgi:hypothetical protein